METCQGDCPSYCASSIWLVLVHWSAPHADDCLAEPFQCCQTLPVAALVWGRLKLVALLGFRSATMSSRAGAGVRLDTALSARANQHAAVSPTSAKSRLCDVPRWYRSNDHSCCRAAQARPCQNDVRLPAPVKRRLVSALLGRVFGSRDFRGQKTSRSVRPHRRGHSLGGGGH